MGYVTLKVRMAEIAHLDFDWPAVPTRFVTLAALKDSIRSRHGGTVLSMRLYRDHVHPENLVTDDESKTLEVSSSKQLGAEAAGSEQPA